MPLLAIDTQGADDLTPVGVMGLPIAVTTSAWLAGSADGLHLLVGEPQIGATAHVLLRRGATALTALPPGLNLSTNGILSGTPTAASQYAFTIQVSDSSSPALTQQQTFSLTISAPSGTLTFSTGDSVSVGSYSTTQITVGAGGLMKTVNVSPTFMVRLTAG